jgi:hypothetical protein
MRLARAARYAWAAPTSCLGLALAMLGRADVARRDGVLEASGPGVARWFDRLAPGRQVMAMTLGHVVLARDTACLDATRAHERVHVAQCERWGPVFVPAYLGASAVAWLWGGDVYADNPFERDAWARAPVTAQAASPTTASM